jgi:hypothetical protein
VGNHNALAHLPAKTHTVNTSVVSSFVMIGVAARLRRRNVKMKFIVLVARVSWYANISLLFKHLRE